MMRNSKKTKKKKKYHEIRHRLLHQPGRLGERLKVVVRDDQIDQIDLTDLTDLTAAVEDKGAFGPGAKYVPFAWTR